MAYGYRLRRLSKVGMVGACFDKKMCVSVTNVKYLYFRYYLARVETLTTELRAQRVRGSENTVLERVALGRLAPGSADGSH